MTTSVCDFEKLLYFEQNLLRFLINIFQNFVMFLNVFFNPFSYRVNCLLVSRYWIITFYLLLVVCYFLFVCYFLLGTLYFFIVLVAFRLLFVTFSSLIAYISLVARSWFSHIFLLHFSKTKVPFRAKCYNLIMRKGIAFNKHWKFIALIPSRCYAMTLWKIFLKVSRCLSSVISPYFLSFERWCTINF